MWHCVYILLIRRDIVYIFFYLDVTLCVHTFIKTWHCVYILLIRRDIVCKFFYLDVTLCVHTFIKTWHCVYILSERRQGPVIVLTVVETAVVLPKDRLRHRRDVNVCRVQVRPKASEQVWYDGLPVQCLRRCASSCLFWCVYCAVHSVTYCLAVFVSCFLWQLCIT